MPWNRGTWNNTMGKNFNFAQMAGAPVVQDANETMTKAFEGKNPDTLGGTSLNNNGNSHAAELHGTEQPTSVATAKDGGNDGQVAQSGNMLPYTGKINEQPKVEQPEVQQFPTINNGGVTMLTAQRRNEQTMTMDDHLRDEWLKYLSTFAGSLTVGANVQLPEGIDDRLDAISKRMRGVVGTVKMPKKNLILLAVWEFVEKYDR